MALFEWPGGIKRWELTADYSDQRRWKRHQIQFRHSTTPVRTTGFHFNICVHLRYLRSSNSLNTMPIFRYQVVDAKGRTLNGSMPAADEASLEQTLKKAGLWITDVKVDRPGSARAAPKFSGRGP